MFRREAAICLSISPISWFRRLMTCLRERICLESRFSRFSELRAVCRVSSNNWLVISISASAALRCFSSSRTLAEFCAETEPTDSTNMTNQKYLILHFITTQRFDDLRQRDTFIFGRNGKIHFHRDIRLHAGEMQRDSSLRSAILHHLHIHLHRERLSVR